MLSIIKSAALMGIDSYPVDVEVDLRYGSVCFGGTTPEEFQIEQNKSLKEYGDNPNIPTIHRGFSDYVQTAFFTKSEREIYIERGKDSLEKELREEQNGLDEFLTNRLLNKKQQNCIWKI